MSWNHRFPTNPPEVTELYTKAELEQAITTFSNLNSSKDVKPAILLEQSRRCLLQLKTELSSVEDFLTRETNYLSAFIYQNGRHQGEKFIQALKQVKKSLKRFDEAKLCREMDNIIELFPLTCYGSAKVRLPSARNFFFLLSSFVGVFRLLLKISSYSMEAAFYLRCKISTGHHFPTMTIFLAFVARIRVLVLDQAKLISEAYDSFAPFWIAILKVKKLQAVDSLPESLKEELEQIQTKKNREDSSDASMNISSLEDNLQAKTEETLIEPKDPPTSFSNSFSSIDNDYNMEDIGEVVSRESFNDINDGGLNKRMKKKIHKKPKVKTKRLSKTGLIKKNIPK